jgi:hypothetical protein
MSTHRILSSLVAVTAACAAISGCVGKAGAGVDSPNAPTRNLAGFFTLQTINGSLLPAVTATSPPNACEGFIDTGRLFLTVDPPTYELATSTRFNCSNGNGPRFPNDTEVGTWKLDGGPQTFTITFTPTGANIYHLTTAAIDTVSVTIRLDAPRQDAGRPAFPITTFWRKQ